MYTAGQAQFSEFKFVVYKQEQNNNGLSAAFSDSRGEGPFVWLHGAHTGSMLVTGVATGHHYRGVKSAAKPGPSAKSELFS